MTRVPTAAALKMAPQNAPLVSIRIARMFMVGSFGFCMYCNITSSGV